MTRTGLRGLSLPSLTLTLMCGALACGGRTTDTGVVSTFERQPQYEIQSQNRVPGIDLLLMIDNSGSMADKQVTFADAVPQLLGQLVQPVCVDDQGNPVLDANGQATHVLLGSGACPVGGIPEHTPVLDIHIGIITSSLGDHGGGSVCTPGQPTSLVDANGNTMVIPPDANDSAHLVGTLARYSSATMNTQNAIMDPNGFLAWGNASRPSMTDGDLVAATGIFADMVKSTHEMGCSFAAQLEGWFRFLIDPVPPILPIQKDPSTYQTYRLGSDDALLAQRAAFLRPDSLVAVVMLTDDNDCSVRDTDVGWVATDNKNSIETSSAACATNPNDPCCYSCTAVGPPGSCADGCGTSAGAAQDDSPFSVQSSLLSREASLWLRIHVSDVTLCRRLDQASTMS